jgi:hypothetical protein
MKRPMMRVVASFCLLLLSQLSVAQKPGSASTPDIDAKLAKYFEIFADIKTIQQRIDEATAAHGTKPAHLALVKTSAQRFVAHGDTSTLPSGVDAELATYTRNSDLVVMGVPMDRRSLPIADQTFLFSEYTVRVSQVFGNNNSGIKAGDLITVARQGGTLEVNGVFVRATDADFELFRLHTPYIFFLRAIPGTPAFQALGSSTFRVDNSNVIRTSKVQAAAQPPENFGTFVSRLETSVHYAQGR